MSSTRHAPLNYFRRPPRPDDWWGVVSFRSRHPGGAQSALAGGSVSFYSESIERVLCRALSTRAGGEALEVP